MIEVCHEIEPFRQPSPARNPGGDCFACALTAAVRYCFPARPASFDQVFEWFRTSYFGETEKRCVSNTWPGMQSAARNAREDGYPLEIITDRVMPQMDGGTERWGYPWPLEIDPAEYTRRLEGYLRGGWVALTEIRYAGGGPYDAEGRRQSQDHFVAIDGARYGWVRKRLETGTEYGVEEHEVRVLCSARGAYWIGADELLRRHGGAGWILVRKDNR